MIDKWNSLDAAAEENLQVSSLSEFYKYKDRLKKDGHEWENDARLILAGFIWDESEER
jgi:hypothetical protein